MYAAYKAGKERKKEKPRSQEDWWGVEGKRGGARLTVEGCLGEYQADQLFAAQGHKKLNHDGQLVGLLDPPRGRGLDGVWKNATPPPEYIITETKYTTTPSKKPSLAAGSGQMSDEWALDPVRLTKAVGKTAADSIILADASKGVEKRLLHIGADGTMKEYVIDAVGKFVI
jgi:hypothetical protein